MTNNPKISVLISAYNAEEYLEDSVTSILRQSFQHFEILIVDDGSTDGTWSTIERMRDPRIRAWRRENHGKAASLNFMMENAVGEYFAIQDADDVSSPIRLERLLTHLSNNEELAMVLSGFSLIIGDRLVAPRCCAKSKEQCALDIESFRMPSHDPTMIFKGKVGRWLGFDPDLRIGQQYDFILRVGEQYPIEVVEDNLYFYRATPTSSTRSNLERRSSFVFRVLEKARLRRGIPPLDEAEFNNNFRHKSNNPVAHFTDSVYLQRRSGQQWGAIKTAAFSLRYSSLSLSTLKPIIYALAPFSIVSAIRARGSNSGH